MKISALRQVILVGGTVLISQLPSCSLPGSMRGAAFAPRADIVGTADEDGSEIRRAQLDEAAVVTGSFMTDLNDSARYLAGLPGGFNSPLSSLRQTERWRLHQANVNELWRQFSGYRQPRIDSWARRELGNLRQQDTLFYPFSGPDILFANAFFPNANNYILCGLEGTDALPELASLSNEQRESGLDGIYTSITTALNCSFFITKDMRVDLQRTAFKGTLPIMLVFLARQGTDIQSVVPIELDAAGNVRDLPPGSASRAFVIRCRSLFGRSKSIYYFQQNLADDGLAGSPKFGRFLAHFGNYATYIKSASYLMHSDEFSSIRSLLLRQSAGILQDDSGIPFRAFDPRTWDVRLYGKYTGVLDIFQSYYQADLLNAYSGNNYRVSDIDFGLGYKFEAGYSNLQLGVRK